MGTHPIFESDFDCLTECRNPAHLHLPRILMHLIIKGDHPSQMWIMAKCAFKIELSALTKSSMSQPPSKSAPVFNWSMSIFLSIAFASITRQTRRHDSVHIEKLEIKVSLAFK